MKEEKLAKLLKKELCYWFEVETCDDTQYDGFLYLKCQLNNNTLLEIIIHEDWDIPYWFEFFIWREYPLEELKLNDSYSAETSALKRPTQKTMTCPHCGKRVETTWRYFCPTCRENITPKTKKAKIDTLEEKLTKFNDKINELQLKRRKKKFTVKWAMKVEVHC